MTKKGFIVSASIFFLLAGLTYVLPIKNAQALENTDSNLQSLQKKIGRDFRYSLDRNEKKINFVGDKKNGLPLNLKGIDKNDPTAISDRFINEYGPYFGAVKPEKELSLLKKDTDSLGMSHFRYGQKYDGVPVFGGQINVHLKKDRTIGSANGKFVPDISLDATPAISADQAAEKAKRLWKEQKRPGEPDVLKSKLYIFNKSLFQNKPNDTKNYLVWRVELYKDRPVAHEYFFIDAKNGELVFQITGIRDVIDRRVYDCSYGDGNCYLDQLISSYTYGRSEGQPVRGPQPILGLSDTDNLYTFLGSAHDYYQNNFSRNGANNLGGLGDGIFSPYVKTDGVTFLDYYASDLCPNAYFDGYEILFCEGLVASDIAGHEYAHAVNNYSVPDGYGDPSGLTYAGESGALNESNSDVFGEALEYAIDGSSDWLIGEDTTLGALRDMSMPSNYTYDDGSGAVPYPNKFHDSNYYCEEEDYGGVHENNSVPNHAAYLMAIGGTYNGYTITGIGRTKEEAIFYRAQDVYYTTSTDFNGAYNDLITACGDLYGGTASADCQEVAKALQAVEMNLSSPCVTSSPIYRFWSTAKQGHFFTISEAETNSIIANDPSWSYEGVAFNAFANQESNSTSIYRFWSTAKQHHFFTASEYEKDSIIANDPSWAYEGIAYYAYASEQFNSTAVYRFWSNAKQGHFFTTSAAERDSIIANDPSWAYEGIAWYVPTS